MMKKTVAQNTSYLTFSYIAQKLLSFVYFVLIARFLGVEDLGKYTFALSFTTMFAVFIDLGLTSALIREIAKYTEKAKDYISAIIGVKLILGVLTYVAVVIAINLMGYPLLTRQLVYLSAIVMVMDSITLSLWGVFRGQQNLKLESLSVILNQFLIVTIGFVIIYLNLPLTYLMAPFIVASLFSLVFALTMIKLRVGSWPQIHFNHELLKPLLVIAWPFALIAIFSRIYGNADSVLLSYLLGADGDKAVGWYQAAMKIPFALQFIPSAFAAAIFPAFSHYFHSDRKQLTYIFNKTMLLLTIIVVPMAFGLVSIAPEAVVILFGSEFMPSIIALQILALGLIFVFLNFPLGSLLNSCDKQVLNTKMMGIVLVINLGLNFIFIPHYQYVASAIIFLFTHGLLFAMSLLAAKDIIPYSKRNLVLVFFRTIVSSIAMVAVVLFLKAYIGVFGAIIPAVAVYLVVLYVIKGFTKEDVIYLRQAIVKK
ncbi:TPA: hypothetical protein DF272_06055 [Candidatus Falkowbacteria bacterium]|nr:hypothetical protein [Candidatus Falkowbacteria bacterium]